MNDYVAPFSQAHMGEYEQGSALSRIILELCGKILQRWETRNRRTRMLHGAESFRPASSARLGSTSGAQGVWAKITSAMNRRNAATFRMCFGIGHYTQLAGGRKPDRAKEKPTDVISLA